MKTEQQVREIIQELKTEMNEMFKQRDSCTKNWQYEECCNQICNQATKINLLLKVLEDG